jgi:type I restriction enzyme S subunit
MCETLVKTEEFKDSPTEKMPEGWEVKPLREIADLQVGFAFKSEWFQEHEGIRLLRGENVGYGSSEWSETRRLPWKMCPNYQEYELVAGDIIIGMDRTFTKSGFKISVLEPDDVPALLVQRVGRFIPINCDHQFLKVLLNSQEYHHALLAQQKGMDIPHLSKTEILEPVVAVPPVDEQRQIAEILNTIDEAIAHTSSLIAKLKQMKAGLLHDLLTRGLDENGELRDAIAHPEQFKPSLLGQIPKEWEAEPFGEHIAQLDSGWSPVCDSEPAVNGERGILKTTAVVWSGYNPLESKKLPSNLQPRYQAVVEADDILITRKGPRERVGVVVHIPLTPPQLMMPDTVFRVRLKESSTLLPAFVPLTLGSIVVQRDWNRKKIGLAEAQVDINYGIVRETLIYIPPKPEQERIVGIINNYNTRIRAEEAYREKLKLQKQGLMHDLLTGKVRVKNA